MIRSGGVASTATLFVLFFAATAAAQTPYNTTNAYLRGKAQPDECWAGIGLNTLFSRPPCIFNNSRPKVNQAYVWGMAEAGQNIWFGTIANPQCITQGGLFPTGSLVPYATESWACEFDRSPYVPSLLPGLIGDFRPPQMFVYNKTTRQVTEITPRQPVSLTNPLGIEPLMYITRGIRAAAVINNMVLFAGPSLISGLNLFAFRADTGQYLGSSVLPVFTNIRQMLVHNGVLYIPVGANNIGGQVLRWTGSVSAPPCASCFQFQNVGNMDGIGAYITLHQGRLYVTTWPNGLPTSLSSLYQSPVIPPGGLTPADLNGWRKIWNASNYEPDPAVAASYAGGAIASFGGYLYWGSMHVPWFSTVLALGAYGTPTTNQEWIDMTVNTFRGAAIFRANNLESTPDVQLLYGLPYLPAFRPGFPKGRFEVVPNRMPANRRTPLYGAPGFNNPYNNYTWSMAVWDNRLWVGTMDWSHSAEQGSKSIFSALGQPIPIEVQSFFAFQRFGADLAVFQSSNSPAVLETDNAFANYSSYGIRNLLPSGNLFVGIANASNLLTSGAGPRGGWELIELERKNGLQPLNLLTGLNCTPAVTGPSTAQCTATFSAPANSGVVTLGTLGVLFAANITVSPTVAVPFGATSVTFPVQVSEVSQPATAYVLAGFNGGTMVAPIEVNPGVPRLTGALVGNGSSGGTTRWFDVRIANGGTGSAKQVTLQNLTIRTLTGTGTVTLLTGPGQSPVLPHNIGPMAIGDARIIRLYFNVPATVQRFSVTEGGAVQSLAGVNYNYSISQMMIP